MTVMMVHQLNVETLTKCSEVVDMEVEEDLEVAVAAVDMEEEVVAEDMEEGEVMEEVVEVDLEEVVAVDLEEAEDITMEEDLGVEEAEGDLEEEEEVVMDQIQVSRILGILFTRNLEIKKRSKKWSSLNFACFVQ